MMEKIKDFQTAVEAAKKNRPEGFAWLYEKTYREKYYIAIKYMKNEAEAEDVLQDAYIKAWERIGTLKEAEKFSSWLGQIVAHTALDALKRKKPLLFSEMTNEDENGEEYFFDSEDEKKENQPELAYTDKEREEILRSMMNALSDEQRLCVMMYYVEEFSIKEIAESLDCPENTVKSRLGYGRKNIKKAAEELRKQGYEFFGLAPMPLFLYLLQMEAAENGVMLALTYGAGVGGSAGFTGILGKVFSGTFLGRKVLRMLGGLLTAGLLFGGYHLTQQLMQDTENPAVETANKKNATQRSKEAADSSVPESEKEPEKTETEDESSVESEPEGTPLQLADEEYPSLLAGDLEKGDFETLLINAPTEMKDGELTKEQISHLILCSTAYDMKTPPVLQKSIEEDDADTVGILLSKDAVNRYLSAITDYRIEGKETAVPEITVMGRHLYLEECISLSTETDGKDIIWDGVEILEMRKKDDRIFVYYRREGDEEEEVIDEDAIDEEEEAVNGETEEEDISQEQDDDDGMGGKHYTQKLYVELKKQNSGKYRIVAVHSLEKPTKEKKG